MNGLIVIIAVSSNALLNNDRAVAQHPDESFSPQQQANAPPLNISKMHDHFTTALIGGEPRRNASQPLARSAKPTCRQYHASERPEPYSSIRSPMNASR
jgi:hypothetical protein